MSLLKNLSGAAVALAFTAQIGSWITLGHGALEARLARTLLTNVEGAIAASREGTGCAPRHVVLETKTPDADTLSPETISLLTTECDALGVAFHPEPTNLDLACDPGQCGDCLGYAQQIRFETPFVAAAYTHYFRKDVYQYTEGYWYLFWLGQWVQIGAPRYRHGVTAGP